MKTACACAQVKPTGGAMGHTYTVRTYVCMSVCIYVPYE